MLRVLGLADPAPGEARRGGHVLVQPLVAAVGLRREDLAELLPGLTLRDGLASVLGEPLDLGLGDRVLHHRHDVRLLVREVHGDRRVHAVERGEHGRGIRRLRRRPPRRQRAIHRRQVHEQLGVLRLHALDVHGARRRALLERAPEALVLALVVRVQADRQRLELRRDGRRVLGVALADAAHEVGPLAEPAAEQSVDLDHPARVAGLRGSGGNVAARRQRCRGHARLLPDPGTPTGLSRR